MVLMLAAGVAGKTVWDVVFAPAPAAAAVAVEAPPAAPQLSPLPQPQKRVKAKKVKARRSVMAPVATPLPEAKEEEQPEVPWLAPPLVSSAPLLDAEDAELEPPLTLDDGNGEAIARMIARSKRQAVQQCFERELKRTPDLAGRVSIELELAPPSRVELVKVSDDLGRPEFTACVHATMKRLAFTGLNEEVTVQLPYTLSAQRK